MTADREPDTAACSTCGDTEVVHMEGQIGAPGSGGDFPCPDCTIEPWEPINE